MSWEEFENLPRKPGWKHEYYGNRAHIRPGSAIVCVSMPVEPRPVRCPLPMRPVTPADIPRLRTAYCDGFRDAPDFYAWTRDSVRKMARQDIEKHFSGKEGTPLAASRVALAHSGRAAKIAGAALLTRDACGPFLNLLFIRPEWQRQGVATALVSAALNELHAAGERTLVSAYLLANEQSGNWHRKFGFVEEPDLWVTQNRLRCACHELERRERAGDLSPEERTALEADCQALEAQWKALAAIQERDGYDAVLPWYRRRHLCREGEKP